MDRKKTQHIVGREESLEIQHRSPTEDDQAVARNLP